MGRMKAGAALLRFEARRAVARSLPAGLWATSRPAACLATVALAAILDAPAECYLAVVAIATTPSVAGPASPDA